MDCIKLDVYVCVCVCLLVGDRLDFHLGYISGNSFSHIRKAYTG